MDSIDTGQSEVAQLRMQIEAEHQACIAALIGINSGTAQHEFIQARLQRMDTYHAQLKEIVGEDEATGILCEVFDATPPQRELQRRVPEE